MILTVYRRIRKAIAAHAKENGIHIVRRASMQSEQERQLNSGDPMAVRQAMSNEVVYAADDTLDITESDCSVEGRICTKSQCDTGSSGQKHGARSQLNEPHELEPEA